MEQTIKESVTNLIWICDENIKAFKPEELKDNSTLLKTWQNEDGKWFCLIGNYTITTNGDGGLISKTDMFIGFDTEEEAILECVKFILKVGMTFKYKKWHQEIKWV
jgi:hypothetical protein